MSQTPIYQLPFPAPTDLARNGPQEFEDLAVAVETALGIVIVVDLGNSSTEFTVNVEDGGYQYVAINDDCDVVLSGWPTSGTGAYVVIEIDMPDPEHAVTFPAAIKWHGDDPPPLAADTRTLVVLFSRDGGTTVEGSYGPSRSTA